MCNYKNSKIKRHFTRYRCSRRNIAYKVAEAIVICEALNWWLSWRLLVGWRSTTELTLWLKQTFCYLFKQFEPHCSTWEGSIFFKVKYSMKIWYVVGISRIVYTFSCTNTSKTWASFVFPQGRKPPTCITFSITW